MRERRVLLQRLSTVSYSAIGTSASHGRLKRAVVLRSTACFRMIDIRSAHPVSASPSVGIISSGRRPPRGRPIRSILNFPSAPLSWLNLGSMRPDQYQVDQGAGLGRTPEK